MSNNMIEKVARVLLAHDPNMQALKRINSKHYDSTMDDEWVNLIPEARAAIEAMMEPTFEIIQAGMNTKDNGDGQLHRRKWRAMIQAALADAGEKQG